MSGNIVCSASMFETLTILINLFTSGLSVNRLDVFILPFLYHFSTPLPFFFLLIVPLSPAPKTKNPAWLPVKSIAVTSEITSPVSGAMTKIKSVFRASIQEKSEALSNKILVFDNTYENISSNALSEIQLEIIECFFLWNLLSKVQHSIH